MKSGRPQAISAFILAGGQSRRFSENKALVSYQGRPFITHVWDNLSGCFESITIVAKPDSIYESLGYSVIEDVLPGQSPLIGLYTGLINSETEWNYFMACDMPFVTCVDIKRLTEALDDKIKNTEIIVPVSPHGIEPLAALYHRSLKESLREEMITTALRSFIRSRNYRTVCFESAKPFINVNTKAQFARIDR